MGVPEVSGELESESDGSDKPSLSDKTPPPILSQSNPTVVNGVHISPHTTSVPLPPPNSLLTGVKQPGLTRGELEKLASLSTSSSCSLVQRGRQQSQSSTSPAATSPTDSAPPSRPPSRPASRAPSVSAGQVGNSGGRPRSSSQISDFFPAPSINRKPSSVHSDKGEGHKFNLKDLLGNGSKLTRKRSTSSRNSETEGRPRSAAGESTASLSEKYGVCQKVAIGKGATSVVRLAHKWDRSEEKLYAIKEFRKRRKNETEKEYVKKLTAEFCISSTLHHPNVVETVDLIQDESQHWCEVMEFCPGGDLYAAIKKGGMSPSEVECCFKQILNGVAYLHSQGVAHRDLKPENLFFDTKGHLKIGDYGASTVFRLPWEATVHMSTGLCGSEPYIAPEQFVGKPYDARLVDVWACGIVYYCLHFAELPWRVAQPATDPLYQAYAAACANPNPTISACPTTINNLNPRACRSLLRKMLEPDPNLRYKIEDVIKHCWVKSIDVCYESAKPIHVHVNARAMGLAYRIEQ